MKADKRRHNGGSSGISREHGVSFEDLQDDYKPVSTTVLRSIPQPHQFLTLCASRYVNWLTINVLALTDCSSRAVQPR